MLVGLEDVLPCPGASTPDTLMRYLPTREYGPLTGSVTSGTPQRLYTFGPETPLLSSNPNRDGGGSWFELDVTLADTVGHTVTLVPVGGAMDVSDFADGETSRYVLTLFGSGAQEVTLGGRRAEVSFAVGGSPEAGEYLQLRVDEEPLNSPEPGTLVLAGLAVGGGLGAWARRKFARDRV